MVRNLSNSAGGILSYFTRHRTAANLLLVILIVAGLFSMPRMRAQFFPDVIVNNVTVSVIWAGAGAEDVDEAMSLMQSIWVPNDTWEAFIVRVMSDRGIDYPAL